MRNHKIAMIFALSLCLLALAGCVNNSGESDNLPVQSNHVHNILSIRNAAGDIVHYGMNRADAERVLGPGEPSLGNFYFYEISYDADIAILYRDDIVAAIMLRGDTGWMLANGAYVGMQIHDLQEFYGITVQENRQFIRQLMGMDESQIPSSINFRFVLEDENYLRLIATYEEFNATMREMIDMPDARRNRFMVDLRIWNDTIDIITIGDEQAITMLN